MQQKVTTIEEEEEEEEEETWWGCYGTDSEIFKSQLDLGNNVKQFNPE